MMNPALIPPPVCLSDEPLTQIEIDGARNKDVIHTLFELFIKHQGGGAPYIRVGLFGGLGQGKTSSWHTATEQVKQYWGEQSTSEWFDIFDVAHYKDDALEHDFDRILFSRLPLFEQIKKYFPTWISQYIIFTFASFIVATIVIWIGKDIFFLLTKESSKEIDLKNGWAPVTLLWFIVQQTILWLSVLIIKPSMGGAFGISQREKERGAHMGKRLFHALFRKPATWLIIDNLDRATDAQQRAVLRSLYKYGKDMQFSVLICMDESRLLNTAPMPESPIELLAKAIQLQVHMPGRVPLDACRIAWQTLYVACCEPWMNDRWCTVLTDPRAIAGLARAMVLTDTNSPRHAKRLANDVNLLHWQMAQQRVAAQTIAPTMGENEAEDARFAYDIRQRRENQLRGQIDSIDDWLAALRIIILNQMQSTLRGDNYTFAQILTSNSTPEFREFILQINGNNEKDAEKLCRIFSATRHWRPRHGEWLPYVAITQLQRGQEANTENLKSRDLQEDDAATPPDYPIFDYYWNCIGKIAAGYGSELLENSNFALNNNHDKNTESIKTTLLLVIDMFCLLAKDVMHIKRVITHFIPWRRNISSSLLIGVDAVTSLWPLLAARDDIATVITERSVRKWLYACRSPDFRLCIASLLPPSLLGLEERLLIVAETPRLTLDEITADFCVNVHAPTKRKNTSRKRKGGEPVNKHMARYWPPIMPLSSELFDLMEKQFSFWRSNFAESDTITELPGSMIYMFFQDSIFFDRIKNSHSEQLRLLDTLITLFPLDGQKLIRFCRKWKNSFAAYPEATKRAIRLRLRLLTLICNAVINDNQIARGNRLFILYLLAVMAGQMCLRKLMNFAPAPSEGQREIIHDILIDQVWHEKLPDCTWKKLTGDKLRPIPLSETRSDSYLYDLHHTHLLANQRPSLVETSIRFLLLRAQDRNQSTKRRRVFLADVQVFRDRFEVMEELIHEIEAATAKRHVTDEVADFWKWIARFPQFANYEEYEKWIGDIDEEITHDLDQVLSQEMQSELTNRIAACMKLAPHDIDQDILSEIDQRLHARARLVTHEPPKLVLIRGLPGSGKSTFAKSMSELKHVEADQYFSRNGTYQFDPTKLGAAHEYCQNKTKKLLQQRYDVVVSNTFVQIWEIEPYLAMTPNIEIFEMQNQYENVHHISDMSIERMRNNWQPIPPWLKRLVKPTPQATEP